jgi:hypothetical protein
MRRLDARRLTAAALFALGAGALVFSAVLATSASAAPCTLPDAAYNKVAAKDSEAAAALQQVKKQYAGRTASAEYEDARFEALRALGYYADCGRQLFERNGDSPNAPDDPKVTPGTNDAEADEAPGGSGAGGGNAAATGTPTTTTTTAPADAAGGGSKSGGADGSGVTTTTGEVVEFNLRDDGKRKNYRSGRNTSRKPVGEIAGVGLVAMAAGLCAWSVPKPGSPSRPGAAPPD